MNRDSKYIMTGSNNSIPFNGLIRQYANLKEEILEAQDEVLKTGQVYRGPKVQEFEKCMAERCNREYAFAVNSCTMGINFVLQNLFYLGTGKKNNRINIAVPGYSFKSTWTAIPENYITSTVDVNYGNRLMDLKQIQSNNDVIMYVNLFGNMLDYDQLEFMTKFWCENETGEPPVIIEDAAQSFGSSWNGKPSGSFGDYSVLSFDPTKNLPNFGGGGMVLMDHKWFANDLEEIIRNCYNSSMSETDSAAMLVKLNYFDEWQKRRSEIAEYYRENLHPEITTPQETLTSDTECSWHKYVIEHTGRDTIQSNLKTAGIESKIHYELEKQNAPGTILANCLALSRKLISLPIYPEMTDAEVERVVEVVNISIP